MITLRAWSPADLDDLVHFANNERIANNLTNMFPHPYTPEAGTAFIAMANSHEPQQIFAIDLDGRAIGAIGIHPQGDIWSKNAEIGYWLAEPYWGKGIITQTIREIVSYGFATFDLERIFARPFGRNLGSQKALQKAGFQFEAQIKQNLFKNGTFEDELIYGIRRPLG